MPQLNWKHLLQTLNINQIFSQHYVNCKTKKGIYLTACILCNDHQYVRKFETAWNGKLYNHRKDANKEKTIPFDEHFSNPGHNFTEHVNMFTIIESLIKHVKTETGCKRLKEREAYWVARQNTNFLVPCDPASYTNLHVLAVKQDMWVKPQNIMTPE